MLEARWHRAIGGVCSVMALIALGALAPMAHADVNFELRGAFGPDGSSSTGFSDAGSVAVDQGGEVVYVLDREANALFKFDLEGNPVDFGGSSPDVSRNELSGLEIGGGLGSRQVAVDQNSHVIYLTGGNTEGRATALQAFKSNGDPSNFTEGPGSGTNEISGLYSIRGLTVDTHGDIFVAGVTESEQGDDIRVYTSTGKVLLQSVEVRGPRILAVDTNGTLYVLRNLSILSRYTPSAYPLTEDTTYTLAPEPVDTDPTISVAVDPLTNRLYALQAHKVSVFGEDGTEEGAFGEPGESGELTEPRGIAIGNVKVAGIQGYVAQPLVANGFVSGLTLPQVEIFREELCVCLP